MRYRFVPCLVTFQLSGREAYKRPARRPGQQRQRDLVPGPAPGIASQQDTAGPSPVQASCWWLRWVGRRLAKQGWGRRPPGSGQQAPLGQDDRTGRPSEVCQSCCQCYGAPRTTRGRWRHWPWRKRQTGTSHPRQRCCWPARARSRRPGTGRGGASIRLRPCRRRWPAWQSGWSLSTCRR